MAEKKILICIGGPTASGKTAYAIKLAEKYQTEIISVDSRQLYKEMNIGTAKPTQEDLERIPHHFINHVSINDPYDVGLFEKESMALLADRFKHHDTLIAVGGSGLYFKAMLEGIDVFPPVSPSILAELKNDYESKGIDYLQKILAISDPVYYSVVDTQNPVRLIRAISIIRETGRPFSTFRKGGKSHRFFTSNCYYLYPDRSLLYENINLRVDSMISNGLIEEVQTFQNNKDLKALQTVGYTEIFEYLSGKCSLQEAIIKVKQHSRQYAKRQLTWFNNAEGWSMIDNKHLL